MASVRSQCDECAKDVNFVDTDGVRVGASHGLEPQPSKSLTEEEVAQNVKAWLLQCPSPRLSDCEKEEKDEVKDTNTTSTCQTCNEVLPAKELIEHLATHLRKGQRVCPVAFCNHAVKYPKLLLDHVSTHYGLKAHQCETCGSEFRNQNALRAHVKTKHVSVAVAGN